MRTVLFVGGGVVHYVPTSSKFFAKHFGVAYAQRIYFNFNQKPQVAKSIIS